MQLNILVCNDDFDYNFDMFIFFFGVSFVFIFVFFFWNGIFLYVIDDIFQCFVLYLIEG